MASTIQIKRGTGSAVPSGLADGELAINLTDGKFYFGSASVSVSDFKFDTLTVTELTSSIVTSSIVRSSGSNIFGDEATDTHQFTGDITASGNISASGNILAQSIASFDHSIGFWNGNSIGLGYENNTPIQIGKLANPTTIVGNITASGNISSSGDIIGSVVYVDNSIIHNGDTDTKIQFTTDDTIDINTGGSVRARIENDGVTVSNGRLKVNSHITASGNISSSGTITANSLVGPLSTAAQPNITSVGTLTNLVVDNVQINSNAINSTSDTDVFISMGTAGLGFEANNGDKFEFNSAQNNVDFQYNGENDGTLLYIDASADKVGIGVSTPGEKLTVAGNISASGNVLTNNITASGNISSSGEIEANTFKAAGNVDFNGDLDVDGTANLDAVDIDGNVQLDGTLTVGVDDTGYDVQLYGNTSGRSVKWIPSVDMLKFMDNTRLGFGTSVANTGFDASILYDGTDLQFSNGGGDIVISENTVRITAGTSGEANLILESDTDNDDENDNPFMSFKQDGGGVAGMIGLSGDADKWPDGTTLTGVEVNAMVIGMTGSAVGSNRQLYLVAGNSASLRVENDADIHIYENLNVAKVISVANVSVVDYDITNSNKLTFGRGNRDSIFQGTAFTVQTPITASIISASDHIYADKYYANGQFALGNLNGAVTLGYDNTYPINIGKSTNPIALHGDVTASGNISASGVITGGSMTVETDGQAQILISTTNTFTNRDVGLNLSASENGQQYSLALDRANDTFVIAPSDVNDAPGNAIFTLDTVGNITASNNISSSGTITADRFLGSQLTMVPFNYFVSSQHSSELYIPQGGSQVEGTSDQPYHFMLAPYDGKVRRLSVYYQTGDPGDLTARVRKAAAPFDLDDSDDIVQAETISSTVDDTAYFFDFSASFSKGDAVAVTLEAASHATNCYVVGSISVEYDTTT